MKNHKYFKEMKLSEKSKKFAEKYSIITLDTTYQKLRLVPRHDNTNTYDHCIRVAVVSVLIARKLKIDPNKVVRSALLHDFCLEDYHGKNTIDNAIYALNHPKVAVQNAKKFRLTKSEKKAILSHMFPMGPIPTSLIAWIVVLADKTVTLYEKLYRPMCMMRTLCKRIKMPFGL